MGLDVKSAEFLVYCRKNGVNFDVTCTLGKQDVKLLPSERKKVGSWIGQDFERTDVADKFLRRLGGQDLHALDASDYEGADIIWNLNEPPTEQLKGRFDVLIDGGTLEHVFDFPSALKHCLQMVKVGGHMIICNMANNEMGHGFYQFSPELFYSAFVEEHGCRLKWIFLNERGTWYRPKSPIEVRGRVQAMSSRSITVFVCVERIAATTPFVKPPHQSDYLAAYRAASGDSTGVGSLTTRQRLGRALPQLKSAVRCLREFKHNVVFPKFPLIEEVEGRWKHLQYERSCSLGNRRTFLKVGRTILEG